MLKNAVLLGYCDLVQLENELFAVAESQMLSILGRFSGFRELVADYMNARTMARPNVVVAPTPVKHRQLEWYMMDHGIQDNAYLHRLDCLHGCHYFVFLQIVGGFEIPAFEPCQNLIDEKVPHGRYVAFASDCIIAGADTKQYLRDIVDVLLDSAKQTGLELRYEEADLELTRVNTWGFEFSRAGIVRDSSPR
jgi:hypothetical protein